MLKRTWGALAFSCLVLTCGCYEDGSGEADGRDEPDSPAEASDILYCDAIAPTISFTFTLGPTGEAYCGPATITYEVLRWGETRTIQCDCVNGAMTSMTYEFASCTVTPHPTEQGSITISVEGYRDMNTMVTLPDGCISYMQVDVVLWPLEPPFE